MQLKIKKSSCCTGGDCCEPRTPKTEMTVEESEKTAPVRRIAIDFLYLDLEVCERCQGTDSTLDEAVSDVAQVLRSAGVEPFVRKVNIATEALAREYRFVSSPTIRIDGRDIALEVKESLCESCGDLCGDTVDCRVWVWQGKEYSQPPKEMIVTALLQAVFSPRTEAESPPVAPYEVPENLRRFYDAMSRKTSYQMSSGIDG